MTRKHYRLIADVLRRTFPVSPSVGVTPQQLSAWSAQNKQWHLMVSSLSDAFVDDFEFFDPVRFKQSALPPSNK